MKKIEKFFDKHAWPLRLGIIVVFLLWVIPGVIIIKMMMDVKEQAIEYDQKAGWQLNHRAQEIADKAIAKGDAYGPIDYYNDRLAIHKMRKDLSPSANPLPEPQSVISTICGISHHNVAKNNFPYQDVENGRAMYERWLKANPAYVLDDVDMVTVKDEAVKKAEMKHDLEVICRWAINAYWRGLILALLLYLTRMARGFESDKKDWVHKVGFVHERRQGILLTVLADKTKFFLALIFWPRWLFKYPSNVIREIVVEAEMRRLDGLFRKFSPIERLRIREIANSEQYGEWREKFRHEHRDRFRYTFAVALFATIIVHLLQPVLKAEAKDAMRAGPSIAVLYEQAQDGQIDDDIGGHTPCETDGPLILPPLLSSERMRWRTDRFSVPIRESGIDQVPEFGCFGGWAVSAVNP